MSRRRAIETALVLLAFGAALVPLPATFVEQWFSTGLYPRVQRVLTPLGNLVPFAWFDVILITIVAVTTTALVRTGRQARRERRWRPLAGRAWQLVVAASVLYLVFLSCWGLNYRRVPMSDRLEMLARVPGREDVMQLGMTAVAQLNALHDSAHRWGWAEDEWRDASLVSAFAQAQRLLEDTPPVVPGRLKPTLLGPYFRWSSVDGMVDPYALEVLVNPDLLPWERPFVAAHEWSHLAGFADESEASFVGWLACLRGDDAAQYSAWLYLYWEVAGDASIDDRKQMSAALQDGPRRDLAAIVERLRRGQFPLLRNASWAVYDQYLRANRVEAGIASYGEVVTLILRARFDEGYRPVRRASAPASP
jgi:Protein of unknown function (DUF3810)